MSFISLFDKKPLVWLITGGGSGFGRALAQAALQRGDRCVLTARDPVRLQAWASDWPEQVLTLSLELSDTAQAASCVRAAQAHWGRLDVLANVAGESMSGSVEEGDEAQVRRLFDINFFGTAAMVRAVLPVMRAQRSGTIINFSSVVGVNPFPGSGYYSASKFAVEGLTDALAQEICPLGLQAMLVEPSGFRTNAQRFDDQTPTHIDDYQATVGAVRAMLRGSAGREPGDPQAAGRILVDLVHGAVPLPRRLPLGGDAVRLVQARLAAWRDEAAMWGDLGASADYSRPADQSIET